MSQTSVETVEAQNSKISPHLLSFAQSCFCKQVHGYTASPQVKPLKYLEITSRFCCCSILHCCPCLHEETTGKTASTRKRQGRFRAHLLGLRRRNASTGSCDLTVAQRFDAMSGVCYLPLTCIHFIQWSYP